MSSYQLKYNNFNSNISESFYHLLATSNQSDIILAVDGQFFKAHQMILSFSSPYFIKLFEENGGKPAMLYMRNVKHNILQLLLVFIYTGEVQVPVEDMHVFMETARELQIKGLINESQEEENDYQESFMETEEACEGGEESCSTEFCEEAAKETTDCVRNDTIQTNVFGNIEESSDLMLEQGRHEIIEEVSNEMKDEAVKRSDEPLTMEEQSQILDDSVKLTTSKKSIKTSEESVKTSEEAIIRKEGKIIKDMPTRSLNPFVKLEKLPIETWVGRKKLKEFEETPEVPEKLQKSKVKAKSFPEIRKTSDPPTPKENCEETSRDSTRNSPVDVDFFEFDDEDEDEGNESKSKEVEVDLNIVKEEPPERFILTFDDEHFQSGTSYLNGNSTTENGPKDGQITCDGSDSDDSDIEIEISENSGTENSNEDPQLPNKMSLKDGEPVQVSLGYMRRRLNMYMQLIHDDYRYIRGTSSVKLWFCSSHSKLNCPAKVYIIGNRRIVFVNSHNHERVAHVNDKAMIVENHTFYYMSAEHWERIRCKK